MSARTAAYSLDRVKGEDMSEIKPAERRGRPTNDPPDRTEKPKKRVGRPRWQPPDLKIVEDTAASVGTMERIAARLGISLPTLYRHQKQYRDFFEAIKRGRNQGIAALENRAVTIAMTGDPTKPATITMIIFLLKTLGGYREGSALTVTSEGDVFGPPRPEKDDHVKNQLDIIAHMTMQERFQYLEILQRSKARIDAGEPPPTAPLFLQRQTENEATVVPVDPNDGRLEPASPEEIEELRNA